MLPSLQIDMNDVDELIGRLGVQRARIPFRVDQMRSNVVLDHLGHQSCDAAADAGDHVHDALAFGLFGQCPLDRIDLAADAADARDQLLFLFDGMGHRWPSYRVPPYAMSIPLVSVGYRANSEAKSGFRTVGQQLQVKLIDLSQQ